MTSTGLGTRKRTARPMHMEMMKGTILAPCVAGGGGDDDGDDEEDEEEEEEA